MFGISVKLRNCGLVILEKGATLETIAERIEPDFQDLKKFKAAIMCVGQGDIYTDKEVFRKKYLHLMDVLQKQNREIIIITVGLLPLGIGEEDFVHIREKNQVIHAISSWQPEGYFIDLFEDMSIKGRVPKQFLKESQLNGIGIEIFIEALGEKLCTHQNF